MQMGAVDWAVVLGFLAASFGVGVAWSRRAASSTSEFFVAGRSVPWWLAGTSMVATTFSADTPLLVTGIVLANGVAGNWLWWNAITGGVLTVFFFAALWRRAGVTTDVELVELRYAGRPASALRGFRALYLALPVNCLILGWVNLAMAKVLGMTLHLPKGVAVGACLALTGAYVTVSGLWGVLVTDLVQFVLMLAVTVALAASAVGAAGGIDRIVAEVPHDRLAVLPPVDAEWMPLATLAVYLGVQWWAAWYPGAEPGGGGYVAQRIFATRSERDGVLATLWFTVAHYVVRTWPWVLTALACWVLYPELRAGGDREGAYVRVMIEHLPRPLRGLMMAGFAAAYMSTVATHLNWGASYLVKDVYLRFVRPDATEREGVRAGRAATVLTMVLAAGVTMLLSSIEEAWKYLLALGSGTGLVLILRWYWWRVNAWSEVSAMAASLVSFVALRQLTPWRPEDPRGFAYLMLATLAVTTVTWVTVTFLTAPEPREKLHAFYRRVRPAGPGWRVIAAETGVAPEGPDLGVRLRDWALGVVMVQGALHGVGRVLLRETALGAGLLAVAVVAGALLWRDLRAME